MSLSALNASIRGAPAHAEPPRDLGGKSASGLQFAAIVNARAAEDLQPIGGSAAATTGASPRERVSPSESAQQSYESRSIDAGLAGLAGLLNGALAPRAATTPSQLVSSDAGGESATPQDASGSAPATALASSAGGGALRRASGGRGASASSDQPADNSAAAAPAATADKGADAGRTLAGLLYGALASSVAATPAQFVPRSAGGVSWRAVEKAGSSVSSDQVSGDRAAAALAPAVERAAGADFANAGVLDRPLTIRTAANGDVALGVSAVQSRTYLGVDSAARSGAKNSIWRSQTFSAAAATAPVRSETAATPAAAAAAAPTPSDTPAAQPSSSRVAAKATAPARSETAATPAATAAAAPTPSDAPAAQPSTSRVAAKATAPARSETAATPADASAAAVPPNDTPATQPSTSRAAATAPARSETADTPAAATAATLTSIETPVAQPSTSRAAATAPARSETAETPADASAAATPADASAAAPTPSDTPAEKRSTSDHKESPGAWLADPSASSAPAATVANASPGLVNAAVNPVMTGVAPIACDQLAARLATEADRLTPQTAPSDSAPATGAASAQAVKELQIDLKPADLGALSVKMRMTQGQLSVVMEVAKPSTLKAIENERSAIADRLGLSAQSLEILIAKPTATNQTSAESDHARDQRPGSQENGQSDPNRPSQGNERQPSRRDNAADRWSRQAAAQFSPFGRGFGDLVV